MNHDIETDAVLDAERLEELGHYDLYSDEVRERLSEIAKEGAVRFDLPIGLVSIVLDTAQYFPGLHGLSGWLAESEGTPVEWSFCANAVRRRDTYVVTNASTDELQQANPLVTEDGVRSYAGAPLMTQNGFVLGAYCVIGTEPRDFSEDELDALRDLADEVMEELEAHRV